MFKNLKGVLNEYRPVFLLAFLFGIFVCLPTVYSISRIGLGNFKGVYPTFNDDEIHYLSRTKDALEGHSELGNPFISEYKNSPSVQPAFFDVIFAFIAKTLGLSIPFIFFINDFILTFIGFILLFFLFFAVTKRKTLSEVFSAFFYLFFLYSFGRPVNPQFSFIFLTLGFILIWKIFENIDANKYNIFLPIMLGLDIGMLVYVYPYFWTALFVVYAVIIFIETVRTKKVFILKNFLLALFTMGIVCLPYFVNLVKAAASPFYKETMERFGMLNNHWPATYVNVFLLCLTLLIVFLFRRKIDSRRYIFSFSLIISGILLNWQNVITGEYLQFSSHYYQVSIFFIFIALSIIFASFAEASKEELIINTKNFLPYLLTAILIIVISSRQLSEIKFGLTSMATSGEMTELQSYRPLFDWLNKNTELGSVILVLNSKIEPYLPVYTHNNLYSYGYSGFYLMSDDELEDRWARKNIFNENINIEVIEENYRDIWLNKFIDKYQNSLMRDKIINKLTGGAIEEPVLLPKNYAERVLSKYNEIKKEDPEKALKKYRIDYILIDKNNGTDRSVDEQLKSLDFVSQAVNINNFVIYQIKE